MDQKLFSDHKCLRQFFLDQNFFWDQKHLLAKSFFWPKVFFQNFLFKQKYFFDDNFFGPKFILDHNFAFDPISFWQKNFLTEFFSYRNFLGPKFWETFVFNLKLIQTNGPNFRPAANILLLDFREGVVLVTGANKEVLVWVWSLTILFFH